MNSRRSNDLIRVKENNTFSFAERSTVPADQQTRLDIQLGILDRKACRFTADAALAKIEGVERATVNAETGLLTAWIEPAKTNRAALEAALTKIGAILPDAELPQERRAGRPKKL